MWCVMMNPNPIHNPNLNQWPSELLIPRTSELSLSSTYALPGGEEVYAVAFFKVLQQQTVDEVLNSIICLWADNFCLQQWKNY